MDIKTDILKEITDKETDPPPKPKPEGHLAQMYTSTTLQDEFIQKVIETNEAAEPLSKYCHSLTGIPPPPSSSKPNPLQQAPLAAFWRLYEPLFKDAHDKYLNIIGAILISLLENNDDPPKLKKLFDSFVQRTKNPDLPPFIQYLRTGVAERPFSFPPNPIYKDDYKLCRMVRLKKDLIECLIAAYDTFCYHHICYTGFDNNNINPPEEHHQEQNNNKNTWRSTYSQPNQDLQYAQDTPFTRTPDNIDQLYDLVLLSNANNLPNAFDDTEQRSLQAELKGPKPKSFVSHSLECYLKLLELNLLQQCTDWLKREVIVGFPNLRIKLFSVSVLPIPIMDPLR